MPWPRLPVGRRRRHGAAEHTEHGHHATDAEVAHFWAVIPFTLLLGAIAVLPLMEQTAHWWERNLNKFYVAGNLGLITLMYLSLLHPDGSFGLALHDARTCHASTSTSRSSSCCSACTSISGGIRLEGDLRGPRAHQLRPSSPAAACWPASSARPAPRCCSIRPLLETNSERKHVAHTVVFFIFVACNCGGLLLPIGDPPLFLGYLNGVDFLWTMSLWRSWLFVNGALLVVYFLVDHFFYYRHETKIDIVRDETRVRAAAVLSDCGPTPCCCWA